MMPTLQGGLDDTESQKPHRRSKLSSEPPGHHGKKGAVHTGLVSPITWPKGSTHG